MRSCKVIAYQKASLFEDDIYKKKAAKAPTPATKPAAFKPEAAPSNSGMGEPGALYVLLVDCS